MKVRLSVDDQPTARNWQIYRARHMKQPSWVTYNHEYLSYFNTHYGEKHLSPSPFLEPPVHVVSEMNEITNLHTHTKKNRKTET